MDDKLILPNNTLATPGVKIPASTLNKYEIACVTAGVPTNVDPILDIIIVTGLRYKTASEILAKLAAIPLENSAEQLAETSIRLADALLAQFRKEAKEDAKKSTESVQS